MNMDDIHKMAEERRQVGLKDSKDPKDILYL